MKKIEIATQKIINLQTAIHYSEIWKKMNKKWVFTNGCFDILHEGHIDTISTASSNGDILMVAINSDESVKRLKGNSRPINNQHSRALLIASLVFVDFVIIFDEDTPYNLIATLLPNVLVKGGDYKVETIIGANEVINNGGQVIIQPTKIGFSTTNIIQLIK